MRRTSPSRVWTLALLAVACAALTGCLGGREHEHVASSGPWSGWEITPSDEFGGRFTLIYINAIVPPWESEPWTAVGYTVGLRGERKPTAWTSRDGVKWEAEQLPPSDSSDRWDRPFTAARRLDTIVAFGLRGEQGDEGVVAWRRTEDTGWYWHSDVRAQTYGALPTTVESVIAEPLFVAVGTTHTASASSISKVESGDGSAWSGGSYPGLSAGTEARQDAADVALSEEVQVIVGRSWPFSPPYDNKDGAIWWSTRGTVSTGWRGSPWTRVPPDELRAEGAGYDAVSGVVPFGSGFVAVGIAALPDERPMAWVSANGRKWSAHVIEEVSAGAWDVAVVGDRLVALGSVGDGPRLGAWISSDGRSWTRLELPEQMTRLQPLERAAVTAGPKGEIGIVASNDVESDIYIGFP